MRKMLFSFLSVCYVTLLVLCFPLPAPPPVVVVVVVVGGGQPHEGDHHGQGDEKSAIGNHCEGEE